LGDGAQRKDRARNPPLEIAEHAGAAETAASAVMATETAAEPPPKRMSIRSKPPTVRRASAVHVL